VLVFSIVSFVQVAAIVPPEKPAKYSKSLMQASGAVVDCFTLSTVS
jgi:hypothetical protein